MATLRVAVIVLNYRGENVIQPCLTSLTRTLSLGDRILVVDNGSEQPLLERMKELFPLIETITLGMNHGFAAGMNSGLRQMQAAGGFDAYWIVNNDVVADPEALSELKRACLELGSQALFSPVIYSEPERKIWFSGGRIDFARMRTLHDQKSVSGAPFQTGFLTGCALFIPAEALEVLGQLDERYFLYYEDAEYSFRAMRNNFPLWVVPKSIVHHVEQSEASPEKTYWLVRSGTEFFLRESRGIWRYWAPLYLTLRKFKNRLDMWWTDNQIAKEVKRAYTDASV